jgi:uncharacterized membrane protein
MDEQQPGGAPSAAPAPHHGGSKDVDDNKAMAAIAYLGILCLIPLLGKKDSPYAQHHAKQGLILVIAWLILFVLNIIPVFGQLVWFIGSIVLLILSIMGIVKALNGEWWEVPVIGQYAKQLKL